MTVTGRSYTATRPRGLAPWKPQAKARALLDAVDEVLDEYTTYLPLTGRQVFYRLVAKGVIDKTERSYAGLLEKLNRARRAGLVDWDAIRDDGVTLRRSQGHDGTASFWSQVHTSARAYRRDRLAGQPVALEVWVEASGMIPQAERVAQRYSIPVQSSGGFDSVTAKHTAAQRFVRSERPTVVLHVGDHDPSGCALIDSLAEDIDAFVADYDSPGIVTFERVAVTPDQIVAHDLPTSPQKSTDRRGEDMSDTVQAEALSPDQLADTLADAIDGHLDADVLADVLANERAERDALVDEIERLAEEAGRRPPP